MSTNKERISDVLPVVDVLWEEKAILWSEAERTATKINESRYKTQETLRYNRTSFQVEADIFSPKLPVTTLHRAASNHVTSTSVKLKRFFTKHARAE